MIRRLLRAPLLLALPVAFAIGACSEKLENSVSCPLLCPGQELELIDTLFDPGVMFDTVLRGFPLIGQETPLLLAARGDSLDVRPIIRFDSLARRFAPVNDTLRPITMVDSVTLTFMLQTNGLKIPRNFSIDAYDVGDTSLVDSLPLTLLPLFDPARLLGTVDIDSVVVRDTTTVRIRLDTARVRALVTDSTAVLRVGLRVRSTESVSFWVVPSTAANNAPRLRYRAATDTLIPALTVAPNSRTPRTPLNVNTDFIDYNLVADAPDLRDGDKAVVGGLPGIRTYYRFALPDWLLDSTAVVSAKLELVQDPVRGPDDSIPIVVKPRLVIAGNVTTDLQRAARLIDLQNVFIRDSIRVAPRDSGLRRFEINGAVNAWRNIEGRRSIPQAIVLVFNDEGARHTGLRFFSLEGPAALRPRLRVTYAPNIRLGRP